MSTGDDGVPREAGGELLRTSDALDGILEADPDVWGLVDEELLRKFLVPYKLIRSYCRVTVDGLDRIPSGPAILACNHTGWLGLDYANLAITIHDDLGRIPNGVVHEMWFRNERIADVARRLGLVPATKDNMVRLLRRGRLVVVFPEAEHGAFKATGKEKYKMLEFKRGFVRVAMETGAPIVPIAILGGEEANPVLGTLSLTDKLFRLPLPIPRNILPRPVKWRIGVTSPISMKGYTKADAGDREAVHALALRVRNRIQRELKRQIKKRGNPVF